MTIPSVGTPIKPGNRSRLRPTPSPPGFRFDPNQPHLGPAFDLLHNLNRQMGATPLAEVAFLLDGYGEGVEALATAVPLADSPNVVRGVYRFTEDETMLLLLGAAVNPLPGSPQPVVALSGVVQLDELGEMHLVFETILRSLRPAEAA